MLVGFYYLKLDSFTKEGKQQDEMQIDTMSIRFLQAIYYHLNGFCKLFSYNSKPIHALLASKRCLIGLQEVPF